ncbi:MAG: ABC transporter ATP-binding protein [Candidatus Thorarchaeota archaeon]|nr:ABC transporter ATP-binding protein [Candidatus Thorarchaeota archaeon]
MTEPIVKATKLVKTFKSVKALNGLTLDIEPGIFGLIGPNGAGKTSFIRILLGLIQPDAGSVKVLNIDVVRDSLQIRERLGVLHEHPTYPKRLTPLQFLHVVQDIYEGGTDPMVLLEAVGISAAAHRKIGTLSAGMLQRLGIAQALISEPELVILDEPTSNLDVVGREEIIRLILDLHNDLGTSFIVSSHVLAELERICDSIALIRGGVILESGRTVDLIRRHTKGRYRIDTDRPQQLASLLEQIQGVGGIRVTGINTVTLSYTLDDLSTFEQKLRDLASRVNCHIYSIQRASTLVDAYMEVITNEP